jgi:hypothetical protein
LFFENLKLNESSVLVAFNRLPGREGFSDDDEIFEREDGPMGFGAFTDRNCLNSIQFES